MSNTKRDRSPPSRKDYRQREGGRKGRSRSVKGITFTCKLTYTMLSIYFSFYFNGWDLLSLSDPGVQDLQDVIGKKTVSVTTHKEKKST